MSDLLKVAIYGPVCLAGAIVGVGLVVLANAGLWLTLAALAQGIAWLVG